MPDVTEEEEQSKHCVSECKPTSWAGAENTIRLQGFPIKLEGFA